jgi:hypothetical protein
MIRFAKIFSLIFLVFCEFLNAYDATLLNCQMLKIKTNQIFISEEGYYVIDEKSSALIAVDGFIKLNNAIFALLPSAYSNLETGRRIFGDTWICSNPHCGYENYDGIEYCAICHTKRNRSKER